MEISQVEDRFTIGVDGKPARVTDYKLYFPADFNQIQKPELVFTTDINYMQPTFKLMPGAIPSAIASLRAQKQANGNIEHGIVSVNDRIAFYQAKTILTGERGIGFQVIPEMPINDYYHTHYKHEGGDDKLVDLFSAFDLWSLGAKGAERYWLVGQNSDWCLVNLYGQQYYHYVKAACMALAKKYDPKKPYDQALSELVECVNQCSFRLYRSDNVVDYKLVS